MADQNNKNEQSRSHNLYYKHHVNKLCSNTATVPTPMMIGGQVPLGDNVQKDPGFVGARSNAFFIFPLLLQVLKSKLERFRKQISSVS